MAGSEALRLQLLPTLIHSCPAHFVTALPANGPAAGRPFHAWGAAAGRGLDREAAIFGAVAEAVERVALISNGANDPRVNPTTGGLPAPDAPSLWQYSAEQLHRIFASTQFAAAATCGRVVDNLWIPGADGDGAPVALPASAVLADEDLRLGLPPVLSSSTGTAVRGDFADAVRHAVLERVERDAVAIWWYNRLPAPRLRPGAGALPQSLAAWLAGRSRTTWHLLPPTDLPVQPVVALSARPDGSRLAIGAAAALDPVAATLSATLEMLQCEINLALMRRAATEPDPPPRPPLLAWSDAARIEPFLAGGDAAELPRATTDAALSDAVRTRGIRMYVADLTRPEFGVPVARVVSPDLRDWQPRFAPGRLFDVPVALGLQRLPTAPGALNPVPFPI